MQPWISEDEFTLTPGQCASTTCYSANSGSGDVEQRIAEISGPEMQDAKIGKTELNSKKNIWLIGDQQRNTSLRHGAIGSDRTLPVRQVHARTLLATSRWIAAPIRWAWSGGGVGAQWMRRTAEGDCQAFSGSSRFDSRCWRRRGTRFVTRVAGGHVG